MQTLPSFARLIALPENRSALAALEVLFVSLTERQRAPDFDLLFLHGPSGTGKTALMQALAEALRETDVSVHLCASQELVPPSADERSDLDLKTARQCDLLIVEDLQHLPHWADEALVQVIEQRQRRQVPTLLTAALGPRQLAHRGIPLSTRLTSRLTAGLVVALEPWQAESRLIFLRELAHQRGLELPAETLAWLAESLTAGGRQLEGALHQIDSLQRLLQEPLGLDQLRAHFDSQIEAQSPTVDRIAAHVGSYFAAKPRDLRSPRRSRDLVMARQVSMYLARRLTPLSLQQIGAFFGGRDHTTVLHACRKVEAALEADAALAGTVRRLCAELS
jgi:chromosomal replication initiator protein